MLRTVIRSCVCAALLSLAAVSIARAESVRAVVRGADALYIRRGPGIDSPAFATLVKGTEVEVEGVVDSWALIRTTRGERGYVHRTFLALPPGTELSQLPRPEGTIPPAPAASPSPMAAPPRPTAVNSAAMPTRPATEARPTATATPVASAQATPETRAVPAEPPTPSPLDVEIASLRARLAALQAVATPAGTGTPEDEASDLRADLQRLLRLTEEVRNQLTVPPPAPPPIEQTQPPDLASTLALAGAGLVLGFLIGTVYGRRQERNRRTRVRF